MAFAGSAPGQTYPNRPITLMSVRQRGVAGPDCAPLRPAALRYPQGDRFVENKGGANGQIAVQAIAMLRLMATPFWSHRVNSIGQSSLYPKPHNSYERLAR